MGRTGRTPAGELQAMKPVVTKKRVPAPKDLGKVATQLWKQITGAYPEDYFRAGDLPLLKAYCQEFERHQKAQAHVETEGEVIETDYGPKRNPWHAVLVAASGSMCQIATKLRLCANSRLSNFRAGNNAEFGATADSQPSARSGLMFGSGVTQ